MNNVVSLFTPDIMEVAKRPRPAISEKEREKASQKGWNNRFCENCGRPYTQKPHWSSFPNVEEDPLWPEWILTAYCKKGLCNGVQPTGECKPRIVETEPKK